MGGALHPSGAERESTLRLPLIPALFTYVLGLYIGQFDLPLSTQGLIFLLLAALSLWAHSFAFKRTRLSSWAVLTLFLLLGVFSIHLYLQPPPSPSHISQFIGLDRIAVEGVLDRPPQRSQRGTQLLIRSQKVIRSGHPLSVEGHLLLFLKEESGPFHVGDRLRFLCRLYSPKGFRNPGGFSYEGHLAFEQIYTLGFLSVKDGWVRIGDGFKNPLLLRIESWRDHIRDFLEKEAPPSSSGIFKALVLGEQGDLPEQVKDSFILTGTAHLLAISGDQFGIVAVLSFSVLIWILKRSEFLLLSISVRKLAAALTIPCIIVYAFIAGGGISVIRAAIMVVTFLLSILFNRERNLLHTLALAAFLILIFSPPSLLDVSFQLSFLAVLSILYLVPRILEGLREEGLSLRSKAPWKKNTWKYVRISLVVTAVATLGTAPFVALHFNRISPIGLATNLFVIPWVGFVIVPLSLIASILSFIYAPFATFLLHINSFITLALLRVLSFLSSFPLASLFVTTPTAFEIALFYSLLSLTVHLRRGKRVRYLFLGLCILLISDLFFWNLRSSFQKDLTLTFIDVGHGDSILVEFPRGGRMLIDGGGLHDERFDIGKNVLAPFLWKRKIQRIDYLVLTHPDPDHLKGLNFIASHFSIGQFWDNGFRGYSDSYSQLEEILFKNRVKRFSLNEGVLPLKINDVQVSIFNPPVKRGAYRESRNSSFINDQSLVMRLQFKKIGILLAADIGKETEYRLLREGYPLRADILKIPHHGSASSSTPFFLNEVNPSCAILSVGERNIGHLPNPEVIRRYQELGCKIFRTDKHGAITVITDGEKVEVRPFVKRKNDEG